MDIPACPCGMCAWWMRCDASKVAARRFHAHCLLLCASITRLQTYTRGTMCLCIIWRASPFSSVCMEERKRKIWIHVRTLSRPMERRKFSFNLALQGRNAIRTNSLAETETPRKIPSHKVCTQRRDPASKQADFTRGCYFSTFFSYSMWLREISSVLIKKLCANGIFIPTHPKGYFNIIN